VCPLDARPDVFHSIIHYQIGNLMSIFLIIFISPFFVLSFLPHRTYTLYNLVPLWLFIFIFIFFREVSCLSFPSMVVISLSLSLPDCSVHWLGCRRPFHLNTIYLFTFGPFCVIERERVCDDPMVNGWKLYIAISVHGAWGQSIQSNFYLNTVSNLCHTLNLRFRVMKVSLCLISIIISVLHRAEHSLRVILLIILCPVVLLFFLHYIDAFGGSDVMVNLLLFGLSADLN